MEAAVLFISLLVALAAPFLMGSFRPRYWYGLESAVFLLCALLCLLIGTRRRPRSPVELKPTYLFLTGWLLWPIIQCIPLPSGLVALLSSKAHEIARLSQPDGLFHPISLQTHSTLDEFLKRLMYACMFTIMLFLPSRRMHLSMALLLIAAAALFHGIYVFLQLGIDPDGVVRSTYTNRNHFALYVAMSMSALIGLGLGIAGEDAGRSARVWLNGQVLGIFGILLVLVTVLMFTVSRGATVSFTVALATTWWLLRNADEDKESFFGRYALILLVAATVLSMFFLGVSSLFSRFSLAEISSGERLLQWSDSLRLAKDYWITGSGAGSYEYVFPAYKSAEYRPLVYHHVHNDYIETFANEGVIGLVLLIGVFVTWLRTLRRIYRSRRDPFLKGLSFGFCLAATTAMVHGFFDFNLQVPANALMLFTMMGLGYATISMNQRRRGTGSKR